MPEYKDSCSFVKRLTSQMKLTIKLNVAVLAFIFLLIAGGSGCGVRHSGEASGDTLPAAESDLNRFKRDGILDIRDSSGRIVVSLDIEMAEDAFSQERGLMYRTWLPENGGMLFLFEKEEYRSFWMKNTRLSLDILFIDAGGIINTIHPYTIPYSEASLPSNAPAQYVLELNAGFCENHGIREGMQISYQKLSDEAEAIYQ